MLDIGKLMQGKAAEENSGNESRLHLDDIDITKLHGATLALQGYIALGGLAISLVHENAVNGYRYVSTMTGNVRGIPFAGRLLSG